MTSKSVFIVVVPYSISTFLNAILNFIELRLNQTFSVEEKLSVVSARLCVEIYL